MIPSMLIGAVAGGRSMTPLAAVSLAAASGRLPGGAHLAEWLGKPWVTAGCVALAAGELAGDKLPSAPNRIVAAGLAGRLATGAIAGAALARKEQRAAAAALGALAAVAASFPTFAARVRATRRIGQTPSGLIEDAAVLGAAAAIVTTATRGRGA